MKLSALNFRLLLLLAMVVSLAANFIDISVPGLLPSEWTHQTSKLLRAGLAFKITFALVGMASLLTSVVSTVGLALFKPWSRPVTLISIVLQAFTYLLTSYVVTSGAKFALCLAANSLVGVIVALAYFSSLADNFAARPKAKSVEAAHLKQFAQ